MSPIYETACDLMYPFLLLIYLLAPTVYGNYEATQRNGECCWQLDDNIECIKFIVTLAPTVSGIYLGAEKPGPSGSMYFVFECDSGLIYEVNRDTACVDGPGPHSITICKPGNDNPYYTIAGIGAAEMSPPITVSNVCSDTIHVVGFDEASLVWTSVPSDPTNESFLYNTLAVQTTTGSDTMIVIPNGASVDSIMYKACGVIEGLACGGSPTPKCDSTWVYFVSDFSVSITPKNAAICKDAGSTPLTATPTGGASPYTYQWFLDGSSISGVQTAPHITPLLGANTL